METDVSSAHDFGLNAWAGTAGPMTRAHRHRELELNYVLRGTMSYLISGRLVMLPPRRLCALWGALPHQLIGAELTPELIWVTVPLSLVLTWNLPNALIGLLLREGIVMERDELPGDVDLLRRWMGDLRGGGKAGPPRATLLEMEARLWRMASRLRRRPGRSPGKSRRRAALLLPAAVERLSRFLAANFRERVSMIDAARAAHVHPNYAVRLFRRHTNMTLHQYLTLQRVAHAQRLLVTTDRTIVDIAFESGFQSVSRFYEAFKTQVGVSPRAYRVRLARLRAPR